MANLDFDPAAAPQQLPPPAANGEEIDPALALPRPENLTGIGGAPVDWNAQQPQGPEISPAHQKLLDWSDHRKTPNIAALPEMTEEKLNKIGERVYRDYQIDENSREKWLKDSKAAIDLADQVAAQKDTPWPGASNIIYPLVTVAALSFAARAYPAIVAGRNVVKGVVYGDDKGVPQMAEDGTPAIEPAQPGDPDAFPGPDGQSVFKPVWKVPPGAIAQRAQRIGEHMSYQLLEEQKGWDADTDTLLHVLPIVGCDFRKSYYNPSEGTNESCRVSAANLVINYKAKSMARAPRTTEIMEKYPHEIREMQDAGLFLKVDLPRPAGAGDDEDHPFTLLEQHRLLDLDDDGFREPYVVTIEKETRKVLRIVARYDADGIKVSRTDPSKIVRIVPILFYTKYDFLPNTDGGIYGKGFGQLLAPINSGINTSLNMLFDAGHLQVVGGGFIGKGISMHSGSIRFKPGEFKVVNSPGASIRDAIVPYTAPEPSAVLFQLLGMLVTAGKEIAGTNDVLEGSANMANMQPTTMLALIEQGLKVFAAIYKRVHRSLKEEYEKLFHLNRIYLEEIASYQQGDLFKQITRDDYIKGSGVCPYSDPEMVSDMQRMARAQLLLAFKDDPRMNGAAIIKTGLEAAKIDKPEQFFAPAPQPDPIIMSTIAETESKISVDRTNEIKNLAQAHLYIAQALEKADGTNLAWLNQQLEIVRLRFEMANGKPAGGAQGPGGSEGGGSPPAEAPPLEGARKAKDGQWYAPDPDRPGKYLQVIADAAAA
jgi:chaperonin GroES